MRRALICGILLAIIAALVLLHSKHITAPVRPPDTQAVAKMLARPPKLDPKHPVVQPDEIQVIDWVYMTADHERVDYAPYKTLRFNGRAKQLRSYKGKLIGDGPCLTTAIEPPGPVRFEDISTQGVTILAPQGTKVRFECRLVGVPQ